MLHSDDSNQVSSSAGVALLMLDVAAAKSSLAQLQQACAAANEQHERSKAELLSLRLQHPHEAPYTLDGLQTSLGSRAAAMQLQALHTENLQLKACLKQEVEARQQLERQHNALLELLRGGRVLELLASGYICSPAHHAGTPRTVQQDNACASQDHLFSNMPADAASPTYRLATGTAAAPTSDNSNSTSGAGRKPERTVSSSSYTSSQADGDSSSGGHQDRSGLHSIAGMPAPSAYFPSQGHQQQQPQQQHAPCSVEGDQQPRHKGPGNSTGQASTLRQLPTPVSVAAGAGMSSAQGSSPASGPPRTWQDSLHHGLFSKVAQHSSTQASSTGVRVSSPQHLNPLLDRSTQLPGPQTLQQQQQQQQGPFLQPIAGQHLPQRPVYVSAQGFEVEEGLLSSSSSSHSAHSDLLDSDDLDELAGLCDSLLQQHTTTAPLDHTAAAACRSQGQHQRQGDWQRLPLDDHRLQELAGRVAGADRAYMQQQQQQEGDRQACVPGLQALAAQLKQLQEQVAATVMDAVPARGGSSSTTPGRPAHAADNTPIRHVRSVDDTTVVGGPVAAGAGSSGWWQADQEAHSEGPGITSLQQQLAHRMQEVKERLSNICNGMLQEPFGSAAAGTDSASAAHPRPVSSFFSPPASPAWQQQPWGQQGNAAGAGGAGHGQGPASHAAGKLGPAVHEDKASAGHGRHLQAPGSIKAVGNSSSRPGQAAASSTLNSPSSAAAFAAIKASIDSRPDAPASAAKTRAAAPDTGGGRPRVGKQPAAPSAGKAAGGAPAAAHTAARSAGAAGSVGAAGSSNGSVSAAAFQGSWASADDTAATDSEGSWATVDEPEQEEEHLQQHRAKHMQGAAIQQPAAAGISAGQASSPDKFGCHSSHSVVSAGDSGSAGSLSRPGASGSLFGRQQHGAWQQQQQHERQQHMLAEAGTNCSGVAVQTTPQKPVQDPEQPVSPVSCGSSMLAANMRMPAEVVYSPLKAAPGVGSGADVISPLRQRNV